MNTQTAPSTSFSGISAAPLPSVRGAEPAVEPGTVMRASTMGRRFGAYAIDALIIGPVGFVVWMVSTFAWVIAAGGSSASGNASDAAAAASLAVVFGLAFLVPLAYYTLVPARSGGGRGRTLGKKLMELRVVSADGNPLTSNQAMVRGFAYAGPALLAVLFGPLLDAACGTDVITFVLFGGQLVYGVVDSLIAPFVGDTRRTLHDRIARTVVIDERFTQAPAAPSIAPYPFA